ncbi:hypothetical protein M3P05_15755 [Sansalvadorimonas sp. 2012CJ34-2]|uniref:Uncharacterized protein n=1 Tax=Parendozoicomonas callyspongiae TaxID=2942213 RepID=A0ABT0PK75_9GAMM|nr:hypothetical protein [Sansalvadorimonas sp. 2012CJ34-2]MCL6271376.1 hypothetical protein [Sansalvadorimonas sp. 2012CJ34-2]
MGIRKTLCSRLFVALSVIYLVISGPVLAESWNQHLVNTLQYYQGDHAQNCIRTGEVFEGGTVALLEICPTDNIPRKKLGKFLVGGEQLSKAVGSHLLFFPNEKPVWVIEKDKYPVPLVYHDELDIDELERLYQTATGDSLLKTAPEWVSQLDNSGIFVNTLSNGSRVFGYEALTLFLGRTVICLSVGPAHDYKGWEEIWDNSFLNNQPFKKIVIMPVFENLAFRYLLQGKLGQWLQSANLWLGADLPEADQRAKYQSRLAVTIARGFLAFYLAPENTSGTYLALQGMYQVLMSSTVLWNVYEKHGLLGSYASTVFAAMLREVMAFSAHNFFDPDS